MKIFFFSLRQLHPLYGLMVVVGSILVQTMYRWKANRSFWTDPSDLLLKGARSCWRPRNVSFLLPSKLLTKMSSLQATHLCQASTSFRFHLVRMFRPMQRPASYYSTKIVHHDSLLILFNETPPVLSLRRVQFKPWWRDRHHIRETFSRKHLYGDPFWCWRIR